MYSRDIFPKYTSGGMPIPENYSGNAIQRTTPRQAVPPRHTSAQSTSPRAAVPLTVSPSFGSRPSAPTAPPQVPRTPSPQPLEVQAEETVREPTAEPEAGRPIAQSLEKEKEVESAPISVACDSHESGFASLLSCFLPPKPGGGILSQIGLEEALLLGLFLLLSQSGEEQDTLLLLALLFLYR